MNLVVCPNCDSEKIAMEKRPGGWFHCQDCHYSWQPYPVRFGFDAPPRKQTVFETLTQSPEMLAEKLIYWEHDEVERVGGGRADCKLILILILILTQGAQVGSLLFFFS